MFAQISSVFTRDEELRTYPRRADEHVVEWQTTLSVRSTTEADFQVCPKGIVQQRSRLER